ncbi:MAG: WecB/TagA/CpsF family glycosyltransferase [Egibacteraceae bacterium]
MTSTMRRVLPDKVPVVGLPVSATSDSEVLGLVGAPPSDRALVVAFCNVHSAMSARRDPELAAILAEADIAAPDGMPLAWGLRALLGRDQPRVYGPRFMRLALQHGVSRQWRHYFYGATAETLAELRAAAESFAPGVWIVGCHAPPFRTLTPEEDAEDAARIAASGADLVWVGLGMPKQERWMAKMRGQLPGVTLLGVGAAFDLLSGRIPEAPEWMRRRGLEWLFRLSREPRRLWRRYLWNNPAYLVLLGLQVIVAQGRALR